MHSVFKNIYLYSLYKRARESAYVCVDVVVLKKVLRNEIFACLLLAPSFIFIDLKLLPEPQGMQIHIQLCAIVRS